MASLLSLDEAAHRYGRSRRGLYDFVRRRPWLPGVIRIGRRIVIDPVKFETALTYRPKARRIA